MLQVISGKQFPKYVIPLIESAKEKIDIVVFDWRWYGADPGASVQLFNQTIVRAVRRGVKIRAITNARDIIDILNKQGIEAKKIISKKLMHAKLMIIDEKIAVTGSHNYTMSAFELNDELSIICDQEDYKTEFKCYFETLWQR